jgi:hypothetical protein
MLAHHGSHGHDMLSTHGHDMTILPGGCIHPAPGHPHMPHMPNPYSHTHPIGGVVDHHPIGHMIGNSHPVGGVADHSHSIGMVARDAHLVGQVVGPNCTTTTTTHVVEIPIVGSISYTGQNVICH